MNFQEIRKYYETPVVEACDAAGIEYRAANTLEPDGDAATSFATARLQFGEMLEPTITCTAFEHLRAAFIVEFACPKGKGPKEAQDFMHLVFCEIKKLKGVTSTNGPTFTALDDTPYYFASMSFGLVIPNELD